MPQLDPTNDRQDGDGLGLLERLKKHVIDSITLTPLASTDNVVQALTKTAVPMVLKRNASDATADLLQFQDETGAVLGGFGSSGTLNGGSLSSSWYDPRLQWLGQSIKRMVAAADQSLSLAWLINSTGNDKPSGANTGDWPYELGKLMAAAAAAWMVRWRVWDDTTQDYDAPVTIQAGPTGIARSIRFPGTNFAFTLPKALVASAPTNLCVDWHGSLDDWTPAALQVLAAHSNGAGARSWWVNVETNGKLTLEWSNDGTALLSATSTVAPTVADGADIWLRFTLRVDNGAAGRDVKFWTSADGATWTQLGTTVTTATATTLFDANSPYYLGSRDGGNTNMMVGNVQEIRVRAGIPGIDAACHTILPTFPEQWEPVSSTSPSGPVGDPILDLFAGAMPGKGLYGANAYLNDATRLPLMLPLSSIRAVFLSSAKNDGNAGVDALYLAAWTAWVTAVKTRLADAVPVICTENPTITGSGTTAQTIRADQIRREKLLALAGQLSLPCLDGWQALTDTGQVAHYTLADGLHPTLAIAAGDTYSGAQILANDAYHAMFRGVISG